MHLITQYGLCLLVLGLGLILYYRIWILRICAIYLFFIELQGVGIITQDLLGEAGMEQWWVVRAIYGLATESIIA